MLKFNYHFCSEAMKGSLPLVKVGLQISDPLYSVLDISRSNIKDVSRVTGWPLGFRVIAFTNLHISICRYFSFTDYYILIRLIPFVFVTVSNFHLSRLLYLSHCIACVTLRLIGLYSKFLQSLCN